MALAPQDAGSGQVQQVGAGRLAERAAAAAGVEQQALGVGRAHVASPQLRQGALADDLASRQQGQRARRRPARIATVVRAVDRAGVATFDDGARLIDTRQRVAVGVSSFSVQ